MKARYNAKKSKLMNANTHKSPTPSNWCCFQERPGSAWTWLVAAFLLAITFLAYIPVIRHGGFVLDDIEYFTDRSSINPLRILLYIWTKVGIFHGGTNSFYPLTYSVLWLEFNLFAFQPMGYHLMNVLLHALSSILLWRILRRLRVPGAPLAAAIFAVHPVNVESVAWITELKNVLSGLFYLLSLLCYLRFPGIPGPGPRTVAPPAESRGQQQLFYCLSIFLFLCALASKTSTVVLPVIILLLIWWKTGRLGRKDFLLISPMFILAACAGLVTMYVENLPISIGVVGLIWAKTPPAGIGVNNWALTLVEHGLLAGRIIWFYIAKLIWPAKLIFFYPRWDVSQTAWWQYLFPLAAITALAALWLGRGKTGRGPLAATLVFIVPLIPVMGFLNVYFMQFSYVADHFQYLASMGLIVMFAATATRACLRRSLDGGNSGLTKAAMPAAGALLLILGLLTWRQSGIYRTADHIWIDTLAKNPSCSIAHVQLGDSLVRQGRTEEAITHYREALRLKPDLAFAHYSWGVALAAQKNADEAIAHYQEALRLKPDLAGAHENWGVALAGQGKLDEAIAHYQEALRLKPDLAGVHDNWGVALAGQGKLDEAIAHYREALRIKPGFAAAQDNWGLALAEQGKLDEATAHYREALHLNPNFAKAHEDWGIALAEQGKPDEAIAHYREALRINPNYADAYYNLGVDLAGQGKLDEAITHYRKAMRLAPDFAKAHESWGIALARQGKAEEAITHYREALRIHPDFAEAHNNWGVALSGQGKAAEAIPHYREALRLKPDYADAQYNLMVDLAGQGNPDDDIAHHREILRLKPGFTEANK
jgi:tetratricopeptide (TPR) repeat protein